MFITTRAQFSRARMEHALDAQPEDVIVGAALAYENSIVAYNEIYDDYSMDRAQDKVPSLMEKKDAMFELARSLTAAIVSANTLERKKKKTERDVCGVKYTPSSGDLPYRRI